MARYALAIDLVNDEESIAAYDRWHRAENGWPEIKKSIRDAGVTSMEIYRTGNRLCMVMEAGKDFSFEVKDSMDAANEKVQEWEKLMSQFQQVLPWAKKGEKWTLMDRIYDLNK